MSLSSSYLSPLNPKLSTFSFCNSGGSDAAELPAVQSLLLTSLAHIYFDIFYDSLFGGLATPPRKPKLVSFVDILRLNVNKARQERQGEGEQANTLSA